MNLEFRKELKEKKDTPRKEHFISSLLLSFAYFSNRSRPSGDQTSILSGPGLCSIATGGRATAKF